MVTRIGSDTGITMRGPSLVDADFTITTQSQNYLISSSSVTETTIDDVVFEAHNPAVTDRSKNVLVSSSIFADISFESLNESIATVDEFGHVMRVTDGNAKILVKSRLLNKRISFRVFRTSGTSTNFFLRYANGSLGKHCTEAIDNRLVGKDGFSRPIYDTQDHGAAVYERNMDNWLEGIDLTCASPWNSRQANKRAGTLISPRHIILAEHYWIENGDTIRFVTNDNQVITRTVTNHLFLGVSNASDGYVTDLSIGVLDSDVPETISFAKVLPANIADYLPTLDYQTSLAVVPAIAFDQDEQLYVTDLSGFQYYVWNNAPVDATRLSFYKYLIPGDSGNPEFLLINNELVIVTTWTWGGPGGGPIIHDYLSELNSMMTTLGGGYQLTEVDLSGFNNYG